MGIEGLRRTMPAPEEGEREVNPAEIASTLKGLEEKLQQEEGEVATLDHEGVQELRKTLMNLGVEPISE